MKVRELASRIQKFHDDLEAHFELWSQSLQQPLPDYPVRNIQQLREQMAGLARQLGPLRPYIDRFSQSTVLAVLGQRWDIYESAVSNDVSVRKGYSIEAALPQLQQILGRLESMNQDEDIPAEQSVRGKERPEMVNIYNLHGSHSRVNIRSEDNSVNVLSITERQVFSGIRDAVSRQVSNVSDRKVILEKLEELEKSVNSDDFTSKYKEFINIVADHMTIILPFLPALAQMLSR